MNKQNWYSGLLHSAPDAESEASQAQTKRFHIELPPSSARRLDRLKHIIEASSYAEVIRNALRIYAALVDELEMGRGVLLRDKNTGEVTSLRIFGS